MARGLPDRDNGGMVATSLKPYAWLSIGAALLTMALKAAAWLMTDSVGLLSDAVESSVNLAGAAMALAMLSVAERPADDGHAFGHGKAEYLSSAFEGLLIVTASIAIVVAAVHRWWQPEPLEQLLPGLSIALVASLVNLVVGRVLLTAGRRHRSITLEADARHLLTDVWTSAGVVLGLGAVLVTDWLWLDPAVAIVVAANIVCTGWRLLRRSVAGLMDSSLPAAERACVVDILERYRTQGVAFHALRTRESGVRRFVSLHVLVPGEWTVTRGHQLAEALERDIRDALPSASVFTHLEPIDDPVALEDVGLDRD